MDRCRKTITRYARIPTLAAILVVGLLGPTSVKAQSSDFGIWSAVGVEKKINKKWNVGAETEFRTRNDSKTPERWSFGVDGSYKLMRYVKVAAAYSLLYDNNKEKITWNPDGNYNNWRPSCKLDPYTDIELFNSWSLTKMRYTIGADYKIRKRHVVGLYYRWQNITGDDDDNQPDCHILGMGYTFKF